MTDKYHSDTQEKIESIIYSPGIKDSADLESGTKTITATSEASGVGNADYSKALTLAKPGDPRLLVKRIGARLAVTIDSMTAGHLYVRVYVDQQDTAHRLFNEDWATTGDKLDGASFTSGDVFNLLADGQAHTFYFFLWVDAGNAVISKVQLWEGVGNYGTSPALCLQLSSHRGWLQFSAVIDKIGTGSANFTVTWIGDTYWMNQLFYGSLAKGQLALTNGGLEFWTQNCSVATDLYSFPYLHFELRSE